MIDKWKTFDSVWHTGHRHEHKSYRILGWVFDITWFFLSNKRLRVVQDGSSSQKYLVNCSVAQGSILVPTIFLLDTNDLRDDVIFNIAIYAILLFSVIRNLICGSNENWLLKLNLT